MNWRLNPMVVAVASAAALGMTAAFAGGTSTKDRGATSGAPATATVTTVLIIDEPKFAELDRNNDRRLSKEEAGSMGEVQQKWDAMDRDRDGYITPEELNYYHAQMTPGQDTPKAAQPGSQITREGASNDVTGARSVPTAPGAPTAGTPGTNASTSQRTAEQLPSGPTSLGVTPDKAGGGASTSDRTAQQLPTGQTSLGVTPDKAGGDASTSDRTAQQLPTGQTSLGVTPDKESGGASTSDRTAQQLPSGPTSLGVTPDNAQRGSGGTVGMDQQRGAQGGAQGAAPNAPATMTIIIIDEPQFVQLDTDRDNRLSKEEVRAVSRLQESWGAFDRDGNGYLTREEINDYNRQLTPGQATGSGSAAPGSTK